MTFPAEGECPLTERVCYIVAAPTCVFAPQRWAHMRRETPQGASAGDSAPQALATTNTLFSERTKPKERSL